MTATQTAEMVGLLAWVSSRVMIQAKSGVLLPLHPYPEQLRIWGYACRQRTLGLPVRIRVLKARQVGASTAIEALIFGDCQNRPNRHGFVCAHDDDSSAILFRMTQLMEEELPPEERRAKDYSNRKEIIFSQPHRSQIQVQTAGKMELGRSGMIHDLHCSEVAFWKRGKQTLLSVLQCVPDQPDTMVIQETTANGASGPFYEGWNDNVRRWNAATTEREQLSGYVPVFISWLSCTDYQIPLQPGQTLEPLDEKEEALVAAGATAAQLKWRRSAIRDKCGSDEELFEQEYPSTPDEAFKTSGRPAIPRAIFERHHQTSCPPARAVHLVERRTLEGAVVTAEPADLNARLCWHVWHEPDPTCDYTVFGDVAEGQLADPADPRSDPDFSAGLVFNRRYLRFDAMFHGRLEAYDFGLQLWMASVWYRNAWASPESNACGIAPLAAFKHKAYPYLYQRTRPEEALNAGEDSPLWGWKTTLANRDFMIDTWVARCRSDPVEGWAPAVLVLQEGLADEEQHFVRKASGKREHQAGYHDDILFGAMGALQLHVLCPRGEFETTPAVKRSRRPMKYAGGVDPGLEVEDMECVTTG